MVLMMMLVAIVISIKENLSASAAQIGADHVGIDDSNGHNGDSDKKSAF